MSVRMIRVTKRMGTVLIHFLLQPRCLGCGAALVRGKLRFCRACLRDLAGPWRKGGGAAGAVLKEFRTSIHPFTLEILKRKLGTPPGERWVVPVPSAKGSRVELLAHEWAPGRVLSVLKKSKPRAQHGLSGGARLDTSMFLSLKPGANINGLDLLVVDDVATTGTTALQAQVVLLQAGARSVEFRSVLESGKGEEK